ncbi:MAG: hypothetical protein GY719_02695 [bacterium]|nr:hypothetical protein [bacterium]
MAKKDAFDPAYLVTLDEIYHCYWTAKKKERIELLRQAVAHFWPDGHPARLVHISGTNGKGSVAHYLEQGLRFAGSTGSWTGPHVFDYAERFHVDAERASHADIVDIYRHHLEPYQRSLAGRHLGFPELGILLSLHLFERRGVAWGMMESGVGGRYTPLMALPVAASVVTNVGGDHPLSLGQELWQRALEKAGVARQGVPFFTAAAGQALELVVRTAESEGVDVHAVSDGDLADVRSRLSQSHQAVASFEVANLALALAIIRHFYPERDPAVLLEAMTSRLPARFWTPEPGVVVDVAHNREKIEQLAEKLKLAYPDRRIRFLVGVTRRRDPVEMFGPLFELAEEIVVTSASYPGRDPEEIAALLREAFEPVSVRPDAREAYREERGRLAEGRLLVLTGSAYMIDQALNPNPYVRHTNASFGWRGRIGDRV